MKTANGDERVLNTCEDLVIRFDKVVVAVRSAEGWMDEWTKPWRRNHPMSWFITEGHKAQVEVSNFSDLILILPFFHSLFQ